jgi:hypothetical protein
MFIWKCYLWAWRSEQVETPKAFANSSPGATPWVQKSVTHPELCKSSRIHDRRENNILINRFRVGDECSPEPSRVARWRAQPWAGIC